MAEALKAAGPWAAFLLLCLAIVVAYYRGKIISPAEHARALETERRIAGFQERRGDVEAARADKAEAALAKMVQQLPPALHALSQSSAGTP